MTTTARRATLSDQSPADSAPIWVLTDGSVGMESQGCAVAEALDRPFEIKRVRRSGFARRLPTWAQVKLPPRRLLAALDGASDSLEPPWPLLVVSIGRHSVPLALALKRLSAGRTAALHIQNPKVDPAYFDIVAAPAHDCLIGANVVITEGAPHRVTAARLAAEIETVARLVAPLPHPRVAVLVGGASKGFRFTPFDAAKLGADLRRLSERTGASLMVTPSRRTGDENTRLLARALEGAPAIVWDGSGANPYFGFLAAADAILVTEDSVNMVTEAAGTGKPIHVYPMTGRSTRIARFHDRLAKRGVTRPFDGTLASWSYSPINDSEKIAEAVRKALGWTA